MAKPTLSRALANVDGATGVPITKLSNLQYLVLFMRSLLTKLADLKTAIENMAGGGGGGQFTNWAYVNPTTGNDATGDGTAAAPWQTAQKAFVTEGRTHVIIGPGQAGNVIFPASNTSRTVSFRGEGKHISQLGHFKMSGGGSFRVQDVGQQSVEFTGDILLEGDVDFQSGDTGGMYVHGLFAPVATVGTMGKLMSGEAGGSAGAVFAERCWVNSLVSAGGQGGAGNGDTQGFSGGDSGGVEAHYCTITASMDAGGGVGGEDGGAGGGSNGNNGMLKARFCDIGAMGSFSSDEVHASMVAGVWVP